MSNFKKLSHVLYRCTYHIVWTPKYRYRVLEGLVRDLLSKDIPMLLEWKSSEMIEMNIQKDHIHLIVSVTSQGIDFTAYGSLERQDRHQDFQKLSSVKNEALLGQPFLGERILCWHNRSWWGKNHEVREISRKAGTSRRAAAVGLWPLIGAFFKSTF